MSNPTALKKDIAENLLKQLGIMEPSCDQINVIEKFILRSINIPKAVFTKKLSERELLCLYLTAKGKTSKEIAESLNIKKTTVDSYKKSVMKKLNCSSMAQSIFEAIYCDHFNLLMSQKSYCLNQF